MTTKTQVVKEAMRDVKERVFVGQIVIDRTDLEIVIRDAVERGIEIGLEQANKPKRKVSKGGKSRTQSVPFDDDDSTFDADEDEDPDYREPYDDQ